MADRAPPCEDVDGDEDSSERVHEPDGRVGGHDGRHQTDRIAAHVVDVVLGQRLDGRHVAAAARDHDAAVDPHEELDADGEAQDHDRSDVDANLRRIVQTCTSTASRERSAKLTVSAAARLQWRRNWTLRVACECVRVRSAREPLVSTSTLE